MDDGQRYRRQPAQLDARHEPQPLPLDPLLAPLLPVDRPKSDKALRTSSAPQVGQRFRFRSVMLRKKTSNFLSQRLQTNS